MLGFSPLSSAAISELGITTLVPATGSVTGRAVVTAAGTRQASASAAILGRAIVTAYEGPIQGNASIIGRATVTANGGYIRVGTAAITGTATVTAIGGAAKFASGAITGRAIFTAIANNAVLASASVLGKADVRATGGVTRSSAVGLITGRSVVTAKGMIYGEEWVKVSPVGDTWLRQE
jgi:hypothetical protein